MKGFGKFFLSGLTFVVIQLFVCDSAWAQGAKRKPPAKPPAAAKSAAAANLPKVTQIDFPGLKNLLKREGENPKPLLINFWATWCEPCVEEFPDLVKIDAEFKGKIDFITISLDDLAEIERDVPKFLAQMNATMPAYLLKTTEEDLAITTVSSNWQGALPFTILFNAKGETAYSRQGIVKPEVLRTELEKTLATGTVQTSLAELPEPEIRTAEDGRREAKDDIAGGQLKIKRFGLTTAIPQKKLQKLKAKYGIEVIENGCLLINVTTDYFAAYNNAIKAEILNKFGSDALKEIGLLGK